MKKKLLFWISLIVLFSIFTLANWVIHSYDRVWFNTLDYKIEIKPEKHPDSIVVRVEFYTDDYHGKGETEINQIDVDGHPVEWQPLDSRQSTFHLGDRYKLDVLDSRILIAYDKSLIDRPLRIRGGLYYKHSMTQRTDYRKFDIATQLTKRDNRSAFKRIKYPVLP